MRNRVNCLRIFFPCSLFSVKENINRIHETESFIYFSVFSAWEIIMVFETHSLGYSSPEGHSRMCRWIQGLESSCVTTGNTSVFVPKNRFFLKTSTSMMSVWKIINLNYVIPYGKQNELGSSLSPRKCSEMHDFFSKPSITGPCSKYDFLSSFFEMAKYDLVKKMNLLTLD